MNVDRLARSRPTRAAWLAAVSLGWALVALGAITDHAVLALVGALLAGTANVAFAKLLLESRSMVHAVVARSHRSVADHEQLGSHLDRIVGVRRDLDELRRQLADAERRFATGVERSEAAVATATADAVRDLSEEVRRVGHAAESAMSAARADADRLERAQRTTGDALRLMHAVVDKLAGRLPVRGGTNDWHALARSGVESPLLSIAIPAFNRPEQLGECLASLEREIGGNFESVEVCVVDDASTDPDAVDVAVDFARRCSFASFTRQSENVGIERNVVAASRMARGEYLLLFGNDDLMVPGALAVIVNDLKTVGAPLHLYDKTRITSEGGPRDAVAGSAPAAIAPGATQRYDRLLDAARPQGFFSTFGFINQTVLRRRPFVDVDPTPYYDLTMYAHVFALVEAFGDLPVVYRNVPIALHRTASPDEKAAEAFGRRESAFMAGGRSKLARYHGTTLAAAWQRLLDRTGLDPAFLAEQPENLMTRLPLLGWIEANRRIDPAVDASFEPSVVADATRFLQHFAVEPAARA